MMAMLKSTVQMMMQRLEEQYRSARESLFHRGEDTAQAVAEMDRKFMEKADEIRKGYDMSNTDVYGRHILDPRLRSGGSASGQLGQADNMTNAAMNQMAQNVAMNQLAQGMSPHAQATSTKAAKPAEEKNGVLFWQGRELPERWMGAHYARIARTPVGKQWKISFISEFSSDTIMLWLSTDEFSGNDADKVAATYLETINQRRLG